MNATMKRFAMITLLGISLASAKTAAEFFTQAASAYAEAKLPTAANEARQGLAQYPADKKLQNLLKRIEEAQKEQKNENDKKNPGDKNDQENQSSSSGGDQNSSQGGQSSDSQDQQKPQNQGQSSSAGASSESGADSSETPLQEGQLSKDQAEQLLKDFQENDKERKRNIQMRGRAVPEKDW